MNTTHRAPRPRVNLPPLPPEVWLNILERACSAGDWNPLDLHSVVDFSLSSVRRRKKIFRESLVTKRYVVRVCKQWNAWASPYLYENLYLGRSKCLRSLRDALFRARDSEDVDVVSHTSGRWTKRLDIALRDKLSAQDIDGRDEDIFLISEIVQCLPNLSIVHFGNRHDPSSPSPILQNLANACGSTLQAVIWENHVPIPSPDAWLAFLEKATHIRILHWPKYLLAHEESKVLPLLSSLESLQVYRYPLFGDFPSLRHLVVSVHLKVDIEWKPFLEVHGMNLEIVQLDLSNHYITSIISLLSAFCPNLVRLDISASDWDLIPWRVDGRALELPPSVRTFGLQNTAIQASSQMYELLFSGLRETKFTSSLSCIQLIDAGNVKNLVQNHHRILMRGLEMLREKGLELRDHEGCLIPLSSTGVPRA